MSWMATAYVKQLGTRDGDPKITPAEKCILFVLADYWNQEKECAWPYVSTIAKEAGVSARYVQKLCRSLEEKGVLSVTATKDNDGADDRNLYRFPGMQMVGFASHSDATKGVNNGSPGDEQPFTGGANNGSPGGEQEDTPGVNNGSDRTVTQPPKNSSSVDADNDEKLRISDVAAQIVGEGGILELLLDSSEYDGNAMGAYLETLQRSQELAANLGELSKDPAKYLRNQVLGHAAKRFVPEIPASSYSRLFKAATQLGSQGAVWILTALAYCETADIQGNPTSYVITVAQNRKREAAA